MTDFHTEVLPKVTDALKAVAGWGIDELAEIAANKIERKENNDIKDDVAEESN